MPKISLTYSAVFVEPWLVDRRAYTRPQHIPRYAYALHMRRPVKTQIKLDGCIVWNAHNIVFGLKRSAVHKLFTSCIRRGLVSRDSILDDDWLPATE